MSASSGVLQRRTSDSGAALNKPGLNVQVDEHEERPEKLSALKDSPDGNQLADSRRQAFREWLTKSAKAESSKVDYRTEERRQQRLQRLTERQAAAEAARAEALEAVRRKAARVVQRRDSAVARVLERQESLAAKVANSLSAAEERRTALIEAERERLRAEHELVLTRLALAREEDSVASEARRKLEERLLAAEEQRQQRLAQHALKAGSKVQRAKAVSALTKQIQQQKAVEKLEKLQDRLDSAEQRRISARNIPMSPNSGTLGSPGEMVSPRRPRISVGGSVNITSPRPTAEQDTLSAFAAAGAQAAPFSPSQSSRLAVISATPSIGSVASADMPQGRTQDDSVASSAVPPHVSALLLEEVNQLVSRASIEMSADLSRTPSPTKVKPSQPLHEERDARLEALRRSISSRKLQAAWRKFSSNHKTTAQLAQAFANTGIIKVGPPSRQASMTDIPVSFLHTKPNSEASTPPAGPTVIGGFNSPVRSPRGADEFDAFARLVQSNNTLRAASAVLRRLAARLKPQDTPPTSAHQHHIHILGHHHAHRQASGAGSHAKAGLQTRLSSGGGASLMTGGASEKNVTRILRRLYPELPKDRVPDRYPPRILLCAFMLINYPEVVFNGSGEREAKLTAAAKEMVAKLERLLARILAPALPAATTQKSSTPQSQQNDDAKSPSKTNASGNTQSVASTAINISSATAAARDVDGDDAGDSSKLQALHTMLSASPVASSIHQYMVQRSHGGAAGEQHVRIAQRLCEFDEAWLQYLDQFAAWKLADAASLESELIRMAAQMEKSLQRKLVRSASAGSPTSTPRSARNIDQVAQQVEHDYELLRERIERLSGSAGIDRLENALRVVREEVAAESMSEMDSATESDVARSGTATPVMGSPRTRGFVNAAPTSPQPAAAATATTAKETGGLKRGFFSAPRKPASYAINATDSSPRPTTSSPRILATAASPPARPAGSPVIPRLNIPSHPIAPSREWSPAPSMEHPALLGAPSPTAAAAGNMQAGPGPGVMPEMLVADVRAPSVPRSPGGGVSLSHSPSPMAMSPRDLGQDAQQVSDSIANLQMVWELVHDPSYRINSDEAETAWDRARSTEQPALPALNAEELSQMSPEEVAGAVRSHARAVAERAFWEATTARLGQAMMANNLADLAVPLLHELGSELADVTAGAAAQQDLRAELSDERLRSYLTSNGTATVAMLQPLAGTLQRIGQLLLLGGAPARDDEARAAQTAAAAFFATAMQTAAPVLQEIVGNSSSKVTLSEDNKQTIMNLATALGRILRLLLAQLKVLKLDAANGRLAILFESVKGDAGIKYLQTKFHALHALPPRDTARAASREEVVGRLPRTVAWLGRASMAAPAIQQYLMAVQLDVTATPVLDAARAAYAAHAASAAVPVNLRSGLRSSPGASTSNARVTGSPVQLQPCTLHTWQGLTRTGLVALISSDKPAVGPMLAETLAWDAERLHTAQNTFQQLVVVTAGMLLVQQTRARSGKPALPGSQLEAAKSRVMVVLADPNMSLPALVSELYQLTVTPAHQQPATPSGSADGSAVDSVAEEAALGKAFQALMNPSSAAFTSISNALAGALSVHLLLSTAYVTGDASGNAAVARLLGRVGAAALHAEVRSLAEKLAAMCSMTEKVFGDVYDVVCPATQQA